jgi:hypothetical protein
MKRPSLLIAAATACLLVLASGLSAFAGVRAARPAAAPVLKEVCVAKNATRALTAPRKGHCARGTARRSMPRGAPGPAGASGPAGAPGLLYSISARSGGQGLLPGETRSVFSQCLGADIATGGGFSTMANLDILSSGPLVSGNSGPFTAWSVTARNTGASIEPLNVTVMCLTSRPASP